MGFNVELVFVQGFRLREVYGMGPKWLACFVTVHRVDSGFLGVSGVWGVSCRQGAPVHPVNLEAFRFGLDARAVRFNLVYSQARFKAQLRARYTSGQKAVNS